MSCVLMRRRAILLAVLPLAGLGGCSRTVHRTVLMTWSFSDMDRDPQFPESDPVWLRFEKYPNSRLLICGKHLRSQLEALGRRTVRVEFEVREAPSWNGWKGYGLSVAAIDGKPFVDGGSARGVFESRGGPSPGIDDLLKK